jgi:hypothetical protein
MALPLLILAPLSIASRAARWFITSKAGRITGLVLGAVFLLKFVDWRAQRRGRREMKDYVEKASNEAAAKRRETRDEIDLDAARVGAAERLRAKWRRG